MHYTLHICAVILTGMILWLWYYILKSFLIRKKPQSSGITKVKAESKPEIKMLPMPKLFKPKFDEPPQSVPSTPSIPSIPSKPSPPVHQDIPELDEIDWPEIPDPEDAVIQVMEDNHPIRPYGNISPRVGSYAIKKFLRRAQQDKLLEETQNDAIDVDELLKYI